MRINIPPIVLLITCGIVGPGLTFANEDGETPPLSVKMVDVTCFRDGGTTGFETQVDGHKELFCLDGRMVPASDQSYMWHHWCPVKLKDENIAGGQDCAPPVILFPVGAGDQ